jgi:uncharacterized protein YjbI with pentapeptide repeats
MDVWLILLVGGLTFFGVLVLLLVLYNKGTMQRLPLWTGLGYAQDPELVLKGYEKVAPKVQIAEVTQEAEEKKQTITYELQPGKTLWDWLQLLLVPVVLAIVAFSFNAGQASVNQQLERQNNQEQVVNTYLGQMSNLLLQYHLHDSQLGDPRRAIAQAITLAALDRLDSEHKNIIILFLYRADLLKYHYYKNNETECGDPKALKKQFSDEQPIITLSQGNIEGVTINDLKLNCIDLHNMYLKGSNFSTSVLDRANLGISLAMGADFSYTSMKAASLYYLDLSDANLQGALLQYADMRGICLSHARLDGADLQHADLSVYHHSVNHATPFCDQSNNATSTQANSSDVVFTRANLTDAVLTRANLTGADLSGADLSGANLDKALLKGTRYNSKEILVKDSQGKYLIEVLPTTWPQGFNPTAAGATANNTLSGADLSGTNLSGTNLSGTDLSGANLSGATLSRATLYNAHLIGAHLSGANLSGADLIYADLSGADLSGASLNGAFLWGADLSGANLSNAKITQTQLNAAKSLKGATMPNGSKHP